MADPNLSSFIWSVADLLRGDYKQSDYGKVILPFTVLRRLDCVLEPTKAAVLAELAKRTQAKINPEPFLLRKSGRLFYNTSPLDLKKLMGDQDHIGENLRAYMHAFSAAVRDIFESFDFHTQIDRLAKAGLLYLVTEKFATIDLHPDTVSNAQMGAVFEELIRKFAELSNETAGEHFTPREVIRLMVNLLFIEDDEALTKPGVVRSLYDRLGNCRRTRRVKAKDRRRSVHVDAAILLAVGAGVERLARTAAITGHLGLPINGTEEPDGDMAGVHHTQSWISLSPRATLRPRLT